MDLEEIQQDKVSYYASYDLDEGDAAALGIPAGNIKMLYTVTGASMRFEAPAGYQFGKLLFHTFRNSNVMVGDEYEEEYGYEYNGTTFKHKLKVWTPASPKKNSFDYNIWEGDAKNILFNYPFFSNVFVKVDIRLVKADASGISTVGTQSLKPQTVTTLDGRTMQRDGAQKGIYIMDGKKFVVK